MSCFLIKELIADPYKMPKQFPPGKLMETVLVGSRGACRLGCLLAASLSGVAAMLRQLALPIARLRLWLQQKPDLALTRSSPASAICK